MTESRMNESHKPESQTERSKKPYTAPLLIEYGPLEKLTRSSGSGAVDGGARMSVCL